ncbi:MAG: GTP 3',8-cyclase MoaA [Armatimonadetes bacterium]|nr:GTP 3',8-cyclase MoaA [Armatimonadota bacterium]
MAPVRPARATVERGPLPERLVDGFGRVHNNLRISITDRCNFRCIYCMPEEMEFFPREFILTYEEIVRLTRIAARLGVDKVRLTGGEPLVRRDLPILVRSLGDLGVLRDLSLTTNGVRLPEMAQELWDAGLRRLNVSLDTLDPQKFAELTRRNLFHRVIAGLEAAARVGFHPIKINVVAIRGYAEDELLDFARLAREQAYQVRFIEFMPLDGDGMWDHARVLTAREILETIGAVYPLERAHPGPTPEPATLYRFRDGRGEIGLIPTVTEPFCTRCNRIRITADGKLRYCLFAIEETDLKTPLRAGASDEEIAWLIVDTVRGKWAGHAINQAGFIKPQRNMSQIGG